jgi:CRP-like cAMP-binding protein
MSEEERDFVAHARMDQAVFGPGETVMAPEAASEVFYTLFEGWAFRYRTLDKGGRQIVAVLLPGDLIGLNVSLGGRAWHGVQTLTAARLCPVRADRFTALFQTHPTMAEVLIQALLLEEELYDRRLVRLGRQRPTQRLSHFMLELRERLLARGAPADDPVEFPLTYQQMMDALGLSRSQLARSLGELRERGWALLGGGRLTFIDPAAMAEFCEFDSGAGSAPRVLI